MARRERAIIDPARAERKEARAISRARELKRMREREHGVSKAFGVCWRMVFAGSLARSGKSEVRAEGTVSASFPVN